MSEAPCRKYPKETKIIIITVTCKDITITKFIHFGDDHLVSDCQEKDQATPT